MTDPDLPEIVISGWRGSIVRRRRGGTERPDRCLVEWDRPTLEMISPEYWALRSSKGKESERMWLDEADLELDDPRHFLKDWQNLGDRFLQSLPPKPR